MLTKNCRKLLAAISLILLLTLPQTQASTGVQSGGDVLGQFLDAIRDSLIMSLTGIGESKEPIDFCRCTDAESTNPHCQALRSLSEEQANFCSNFVQQTHASMLAMNKSESRTPFKITSEPLLVEGPDGKPMIVSAMTPLGPQGDITFNTEAIRPLSPSRLLFLMTHEFGHKQLFPHTNEQGETIQYVDDNPPIGPFAGTGGGRRLIDAAANAIALYAVNNSHIGSYFGIKDLYECHSYLLLGNGDYVGGSAAGYSERTFIDGTNYDAYETGINGSGTDLQCYLELGDRRIFIKTKFREEVGCKDYKTGGHADRRWSNLEVWSVAKQESQAEEWDEPVLIQQIRHPGINPICGENQTRIIEHRMTHEGKDFYFRIKYDGSSGVIGY